MSPHDEKLPITVCVLCLNEAANLPRCLAQIEPFAEWIVLDTGSTDDSIAIATKLGATVGEQKWEGFTETRRIHFRMAAQPWILWLDADEVITPEFVAELRVLFADGPDLPHAAYRLNRVMHFLGRWVRHGSWYPDRVVRLFRRDAWSMPERAVHESLTIDGTIGDLQAEVPHYSYRDWEDRRARGIGYAKLWARDKAAAGKTAGPLSPHLHAAWSFLRGALLKGGILDGWFGLRVAWSNAAVVYHKYRLLRSS